MSRSLLVLACGIAAVLAAALSLLFVFLGVELGSDSRPQAEALPAQTDGLLQNSNQYKSEVSGYSIVFPRDWTEVPSSIKMGDASTDVFYSLNTGGSVGVVPTLSITTESVPSGTSLDDYLKVRLQFLDSVNTEVSAPRQVRVDGVSAYLVDYDGYSRNNGVEATSIVLVKDGTGWEFTFAAPAGERSRWRPLLASVLRNVDIP